MSAKKKAKKAALPPAPPLKTCTKCGFAGGKYGSGFRPRVEGGTRAACYECELASNRARYDAAVARRGSEYSALNPEDFDVNTGANDGRIDPKAAQAKRQEYSKAMGEFADNLAASGGDSDGMDPRLGSYVANLAEQERRFGNRRMARSVSIAAAHESLALRQFKQAAEEYLSSKVTPTGYALKKGDIHAKRDVVLLLSDLHFGAELDEASNPIPYRAVEEARRFEYVVRQALDYKPQYRKHSRLRLLLNGDMIEGMLMHDWRAGAPLTEQKVVFWRYLSTAIGLFAQQYPEVMVECQPGNHGRDKLRHPGRATEFKWDGIEWQMYYALKMMCSELKNVSWSIPFKAVSVLDLFGAKALMTHGDTEVKISDPDTQAARNALELEKVNASRIYGHEFELFICGHFHKSRYQGGHVTKVFNGALVPPNGYARGAGYINEPCSQTIWEAVEGHPVGDYRRIEVGGSQDRDERLGVLIKPFRFQGAEL